MMPDSVLDRADVYARNVHVPAVDVITLGHGVHDARINSIAVDNLNLRESNALLEARRSFDARNHHELDELLAFVGQLATLGLFKPVFGRRDVLCGEGFEKLLGRWSAGALDWRSATATHHLELVLPKLLLLCLVEEGKVANMVNEDVSQDRELRIEGGNLAHVGLERRAKTLESGGRVEFRDLIPDLLGDEFSLEVYHT